MSRVLIKKLSVWLLPVAWTMAIISCKQAGYEVNQPGEVGIPQIFQGAATIPPTARVEVLDRGVSVTWTLVGNKVDIRPTADSVDADYLGKSECENPGLIQASYDLGEGTKPVVDRNECSSLAVGQHIFTAPGEYYIQMQVRSQDNELAWASMTLRVLDPSTPRNDIEGGFTIHARPMIQTVGAPINFTGICELKGALTVSWDFGDKSTGQGAVTEHAYAAAGQYRVTALCSSESGKSLQASLTLVVLEGPAPTLPEVPVPVPAQNPNWPPAVVAPGCDPTQGPCQTGTQMPQGGTQIPTNAGKVWFYDPKCGCYVQYSK